MLKHDVPYYINRVVEQLRNNNTFVLNAGIILTDYPLIYGAFVAWDNGTGILIADSSSNWSILTKTGIDYVDGKVITPEYPYFQHGHPLELNEVLEDLGKTQDKKKYPLIYMREDVEETFENQPEVVLNNIEIYALTLNSVKTMRSEDRTNVTFEPILIPLWNKFIETLDYMGIIYTVNSKLNRKYWGRQETYKNARNILDDPIDGIESKLNITIVEDNFC